MDPLRFDALTRSLVRTTPRRRLLGALLGLGAARLAPRPAGAACPPDQTAAAGGRCVCRTTGRPPVNGACPCASGHKRCAPGAPCVPLNGCCADSECSHLTDDCAVGVCAAGTCVAQPQNEGGTCHLDGGICQSGGCVCPGEGLSCDGECLCGCPPGTTCTQCMNLYSGSLRICPAGTRCVSGTCYADQCTAEIGGKAACGPLPSGACICAVSAEQEPFCAQYNSGSFCPLSDQCATSGDCPSGTSCVHGGTIPCTHNVCLPPCA